MIQTALGPVAPEALGVTLAHEHLVVGWPGVTLDRRLAAGRAETVRACVAQARALRNQGVSTIIDPAPIELGRDPALAAEVSAASGLNVIVATGLYNEAIGIPHYFRELTVEALTELFVHELTEGIGDTGVRAGVIKVAAGGVPGISAAGKGGLTEAETRVHRAAGRASARTGAPVITHNDERAPAGRRQLALLTEEGAEPHRVVIGHSDAVGNLRYYFAVREAGGVLGFDRFGVESFCSDRQRGAALAAVVAAGHGAGVVVSTDAAMVWLGEPGETIRSVRESCPSWKAAHVLDEVLPMLRAMGVPDRDVDALVVDNPRRLFEPAPAPAPGAATPAPGGR